MNTFRRVFSVLFALLLFSATDRVMGQQTTDAYNLMKKVCERSAFNDMSGEITLRLVNKRGDKKVRKIKIWSKKNAKSETRMLMRFIHPPDVKGTGFLLIEHSDGEDDRRLFLPALRRVQRISASGKGGNFMSSDFTYYDIGAPKVTDWKYTFRQSEKVSSVMCRVIDGIAANPKIVEETGYSKITWYVDANRQIALKADYFNKDGELFKTMMVEKVDMISGTPFATSMKMENILTGHKSEMVFSNLKTNMGIKDKVFTERSLRKWTR